MIRAKNSLVKNLPGEGCYGKDYSALAKNNFSEELSGTESSERRTFRRRIIRRRIILAKNYPIIPSGKYIGAKIVPAKNPPRTNQKTREGGIPGESTQGWHHGSENLSQNFLMDSPINLKYSYILAKLSKMKTRIFAAY
jgi:hypothetical protein